MESNKKKLKWTPTITTKCVDRLDFVHFEIGFFLGFPLVCGVQTDCFFVLFFFFGYFGQSKLRVPCCCSSNEGIHIFYPQLLWASETIWSVYPQNTRQTGPVPFYSMNDEFVSAILPLRRYKSRRNFFEISIFILSIRMKFPSPFCLGKCAQWINMATVWFFLFWNTFNSPCRWVITCVSADRIRLPSFVFFIPKFILFIQPSLCIFLETPPSIISSPSNQNQTNKYVCDEFYDFLHEFLVVDIEKEFLCDYHKNIDLVSCCTLRVFYFFIFFFYLSERKKRESAPLLHTHTSPFFVCVFVCTWRGIGTH